MDDQREALLQNIFDEDYLTKHVSNSRLINSRNGVNRTTELRN